MSEDERTSLCIAVQKALWPTHPLGRNILGTRDTILRFDREKIRSFMARNYTTDRLVIACAGNVEHERLVSEFASRFSSLPRGAQPNTPPPAASQGRLLIKQRDTEQVYLCLGGPALPRNDERKAALYLLDTILGGGVSSLLFQELRKNEGWCIIPILIMLPIAGLFSILLVSADKTLIKS